MTVKFDDNPKVIEITPKSKNETYQYTGDDNDVVFTVNVGDLSGGTYDEIHYRSFATWAKNGTDLTVTTLFYDTVKNTPKLVTTTIKDFSGEHYHHAAIPNQDKNATADINVFPNGLNMYSSVATEQSLDFTNGRDFILASQKNGADLALVNGGGDSVYDIKGNDGYQMSASYYDAGDYTHSDAIYDFDGNDNYSASNGNKSEIADFKGNDEYNSDEATTLTIINDYKGNDEYYSRDGATLNAVDYAGNDYYWSGEGNLNVDDRLGNDIYQKTAENEDNSTTRIFDTKGNDTYNFNSEDGTLKGSMLIVDSAGNDKYSMRKVQLNTKFDLFDTNIISDSDGNDTYDVSNNSKGFAIFDEKGNDKYTIKDMTGLNPSAWNNNFKIEDHNGNDTYDYNNVRYTGLADYILSDTYGNDKYKFNDTAFINMLDVTGNDTYDISDSNVVYIEDNYGNNKYTVTNSNDVNIDTEEGADTYKIVNSTNVDISDYDEKSKDKYDISAGSKNVDITEYGGSDTYNIKGSYDRKTDTTNWIGDVDIEDFKGNDTYNFQYVDGSLTDNSEWAEIEDDDGNDKYNIVSSMSISIEDDEYTNDTYNVSGIGTDHVRFIDHNGSDKYTIKGTKGNYFTNIKIEDNGYNYTYDDVQYKSNDTYNIEYVKNDNNSYYISDGGGDNTYNVKNSKTDIYVGADSELCNDKLNITNCGLNDNLSVSIKDENGKSTGTYNIKASSATIDDDGCNDKYNISALGNNRIIVSDTGSDNDSMTISGIGKKDLLYMTNFRKTGGYDDSNSSLMVYDTKNNGFVQIKEYFAKDGNGDYVSLTHGNGFIEELKVDKKITDGDDYISDWALRFKEIREEVGSWLATNNYNDVIDVLTNEHTEGDIETLTAYFVPNNA